MMGRPKKSYDPNDGESVIADSPISEDSGDTAEIIIDGIVDPCNGCKIGNGSFACRSCIEYKG